MALGTLVLDPHRGGILLATDKRVSVDVPAGAVTSADVAASGGQLNLRLAQIAPASGSSAGGGGRVSFGTFLVQVLDASGRLATHGLRKPVNLVLQFGAREVAVGLDHAFVVLNGTIPQATNFNPDPSGAPMGVDTAGLGSPSTQALTLNSPQKTLGGPVSMSSPSTTVSFNTNSPVAAFGKPDPFNVDLNAGSLTANYPIDVPRGPGGLTPPLTLSYGSAGVAEQHSPQAAAPWVGEGWSLSLGSISWAEHNVTARAGGSTWEDSWLLSDQFGTASELIPPTTTTKTSNDDSSNPITPSPVTWHTSPETHARVVSFTTPNFTDDPAAVSWGSNHVDLFARGQDGALWHRGFDTSGWQPWGSLAGTVVGSPAAASWGSGHLDVFARSTDNNLWHRGFDSSGWHAWDNIGAPPGLTLTQDPAAVSWGLNRVDVFDAASDGNLWHKAFTTSGWSGWDSLGVAPGTTWASGPTAASWGSGHLDVFALGGNGAVWHRGYDVNSRFIVGGGE